MIEEISELIQKGQAKKVVKLVCTKIFQTIGQCIS